ncbi:hypothetical protein RhiirA4_485189 [Rhizophagus irregularis]|uniref:Uncharacterized protein n=1 Tax=Rhizophagus irregularis TaxID=588596 RepID=A0A2I1HPU6_9GLOM|nr:hypothetical protein RhiirA4_485189 [Rhizophagus irregularis]
MVVTGKNGTGKTNLLANLVLDPRAPYYENISFSYIPPEKIPSTRVFLLKRSTLIIFEDVCLAPEHIQNRIGQFFGNERHQNISCVYVTQKYHKLIDAVGIIFTVTARAVTP